MSAASVGDAVERHQMIFCPVVVHVRGRQEPRHRLDGVDEIADERRVTEVEADAGLGQLELVLEEPDQRVRRRQAVRNDLDGDAHAQRRRERADLLETSRGRALAVLRPGRRRRVGVSQVHDDEAGRHAPRHLESRGGFADRPRAVGLVRGGERQRPDPLAVDVPLDDGRVDRVERERVLTQPPDELVDRRSVVVVEVAPRGEQLDAVESALGELAQVAPAQPLVVIQVRGDAEPHVRATPFLEAVDASFYPSSSTCWASSSRSLPKRG
jgi:hypothetical protein